MPGGTHPPLSVIESWPPPSPNPQRRGYDIFVLMIVLYSICLVVVGLRLQARLFICRNPGLDDLFIVLAMIFLLPMAVIVAGATTFWGFDKHVWDLTPAEAVLTRKLVMVADAIYVVIACFTKTSILLFYRRLSAGALSPVFHWMVRTAITWVVITAITFEIALFFSCRPLNAYWNQVNYNWLKTHEEGVNYHCYAEGAENIANAGISMAQDFLACFMPLVLFWTVPFPLRQKLALAAIFFVGFFTCLCAVGRIVYLYKTFYTTYDVTWEANRAWLWFGIESHLGIICASAPALKVYLRKYFPDSQITHPLSTIAVNKPATNTGPSGTVRTSDEKSVLGKSDLYEYPGSLGFSHKKTNESIHEIDLERLESHRGTAVAGEIKFASERKPSNPLKTQTNVAKKTSTDAFKSINFPHEAQ